METKLILIVEDDPDHEFFALRALKRNALGEEIAVVRDGPEVLEYLYGEGRHVGRDASRQPDLVLLDLHLPKMNGLEVLREIRTRQLSRTTPVVVFTTSVYERDRWLAYDLGVNSYVRKPLSLTESNETMAEVARYWLSMNRVAAIR